MTRPENLRVVMFDPGCFLPYYVDQLCRGLAALGVRPRVISSPPLFAPMDAGGRYDIDEYFFPFLRGVRRTLVRRRPAIRQAIKGLTYPAGLARTWRALREGAPGILHLQWAPVPLLDGRVVRAVKQRGWRVVYTAHDPLPGPSRGRARERHRMLLESVDAVVVHTAQQRDELVRAAPGVRDHVHVIAHGALQFPIPAAAERARHREHLGVAPDRQVLLFFGLLKPYKGLEHLVSAMSRIVARFPRALLLIAGEPLMPLDALHHQIRALGLANHVSLRPGFVPENEVAAHFRAADVVVTPYVSVGASGVVVLAQGHGVPVVTTNVGGLPEFVEHGRSGFVVPPRDPVALAGAICHALGDPVALAAMGRCGWERLGVMNRWADVAERTLALYAGRVMGSLGRATPGGRPAVTAR